jgi:hypothetical protein
MPPERGFSSEEAQLSIDFIIGFTIFMIAFIFVATMMSSLLINLQSKTIDYDAVAYRTGVVLVEDPGEPDNWQGLDLQFQSERDLLKRLGLSIARNSPEIVQESKIDKFFSFSAAGCSGVDFLCYPSDYREKLIFGDYPYNFNISLRDLTTSQIRSVGEVSPDRYGYIRRVVAIKKPGYTIININNDVADTPVNRSIDIDIILGNIYNPLINPAYRLDPLNEDTPIYLYNITDAATSLTSVSIAQYPGGTPLTIPVLSPTILVNSTPAPLWALPVTNGTSIVIEGGYLPSQGIGQLDEVILTLEFDRPAYEGSTVFPDRDGVTPPLSPAVLEVKIW